MDSGTEGSQPRESEVTTPTEAADKFLQQAETERKQIEKSDLRFAASLAALVVGVQLARIAAPGETASGWVQTVHSMIPSEMTVPMIRAGFAIAVGGGLNAVREKMMNESRYERWRRAIVDGAKARKARFEPKR